MQTLEAILEKANSEIQSAPDLKTLEHLRVKYLGKKGELTEVVKTLGNLAPEERPLAGQKINAAKQTIQTLLEARISNLTNLEIEKKLSAETIDVTLSGRQLEFGSLHPVNQTMDELRTIFAKMGFVFLDGPEIEDDYHNFAALNIPENHPSRAMQDTFYFPDNLLLRTHMSPVEIRAMKSLSLPFRMIAMGKVYRCDFDITHTPMFHQMECLVIDEDISLANLKSLITHFLQEFFAREIQIRLRASYFPFTEPSAEVDMGCIKCEGKGCRICKYTGFLEILGCGMLHPNVLTMAGIDSEKYSGFALGMGIDRLTLLKYGIHDLRALFENDLRFLRQY